MHTCYLVGAGEFTARGLALTPEDFVIAADGGYQALSAIGIRPNLLVGDFDSLAVRPLDVPTRTFPTEKDDTDMGIAIAEGWARGYRDFAFYGAGGGRMDHFMANLQLMGGVCKRGATARMVCPGLDVYALTNGTLPLPSREVGTVVSVFCHGERAEGVTLKGLKYPLTRALLTCDHPLGVSNEYAGEYPSVTVERGTLLIFITLVRQGQRPRGSATEGR